MKPLRGVISDRLRKLFTADDTAWTPQRPADGGQKRGKVPKGVDGTQLGGRKRKKK